MVGIRIAFALVFILAICPASTLADIDYSSIGETYSQDFDTLAADGAINSWANNPVGELHGWHLFRVPLASEPSSPVPIDFYSTGDEAASSARFYSFGSGEDDRAFGAIGGSNLGSFIGSGFHLLETGAIIGWVAASFTNNTGSELTQFTVNFSGEQWGDGAGESTDPQTMTFEYGYGSTFGAVTEWLSPGGDFDWSSPVTENVGQVDGNTDGHAANRGGTITEQSWAIGETLWLRWVERNDFGVDLGLAIDDFSFSATNSAVPEPRAALLGGAVCVGIVLAAGLRRATLKLIGAADPVILGRE